MHLNEIRLDDLERSDKSLFYKQNLHDWNFTEIQSIKIGEFGEYQILCKSFFNGDKYYALYNAKTDELVGFVTTTRFSKKANSEMILNLGFAPKYQRKGLALRLYKFLILKMNKMLISGDMQTVDSKNLWERLWQTPGILVFGYDIKTKKTFQLDDSSFDAVSKEVYHEGILIQLNQIHPHDKTLSINHSVTASQNGWLERKIVPFRESGCELVPKDQVCIIIFSFWQPVELLRAGF